MQFRDLQIFLKFQYVIWHIKFESTFKPKVLGNWQVPKLNINRPKSRRGKTKVIANDRGHLLPDIKRSSTNPWGNFVGNWRLPKKIDKKTAYRLNGLINSNLEDKQATQSTQESSIIEKESNKENVQPTNTTALPYVPGDLTDKKYQHPSYEELAANRFPVDKPRPNGFPKIREDFSRPIEVEKDLSKEVEEFYNNHKQMLQVEIPKKSPQPKKERLFSPIIAAISNFTMAKKLHKENLEHSPLPDTLTDAMYRKMLMERQGKDGEEKYFATGIGWKGHPGYGPTKCTKLKIYRPKTSGSLKDEPISNFDRKWRFIRQSKVSPMDLAICWDLTPEDPKDEPERLKHIDGSNGSAAPAVFSLVHTPKGEENEPKCDGIHGCGPLFNHSEKGNEQKEYIFHRSKKASLRSTSSSSDSNKRAKSAFEGEKLSVCSKESDISIKSRAKSAYNIYEAGTEKNNNKIHQSSPNLSEENKSCKKHSKKYCVACEMKNVSLTDKRPKSEYKMAFKAGIPNKTVSRPSYTLKVPKPKVPYVVKNYVIDSLAAPFCLQKKKREDYPEHWRLATVYQHSYKPIYARKRPLMQTVFK